MDAQELVTFDDSEFPIQSEEVSTTQRDFEKPKDHVFKVPLPPLRKSRGGPYSYVSPKVPLDKPWDLLTISPLGGYVRKNKPYDRPAKIQARDEPLVIQGPSGPEVVAPRFEVDARYVDINRLPAYDLLTQAEAEICLVAKLTPLELFQIKLGFNLWHIDQPRLGPNNRLEIGAFDLDRPDIIPIRIWRFIIILFLKTTTMVF